MMTASEVATFLLKHCRTLSVFESYMFGSTLHGIGSDVDILIVGPSGESLSMLKQEIIAAGRELPLDVLYMEPSEAIETDFVRSENCVELSALALKDNDHSSQVKS